MYSDKQSRVISKGKALFESRATLMSLWQELAENFYPERADFTYRRSLGDEFADHLQDSYPLLVRRELGNSFGNILRPAGQQWFEATVAYDEEALSQSAKSWLEWATAIQRRAMYDRRAQFARASKESDHDWATFGQCGIHVRKNSTADALLFKTVHLRDLAWAENQDGKVDTVYRRWKPYAWDLVRMFPETVHSKVRETADKNPFAQVECWHAILPADRYEVERNALPYVSLYVDVANQHVMYEAGSRRRQYVIPRWQTVSGSQYAYSPATIVALPDARLIQAITYTLLEAGEKYVNPPLVATEEVVRSDVGYYAGGITWVDSDYDERLGQALRPMTLDKGGMPVGFEMSDRQKDQIARAFFINKLSMPPTDHQMTAYETAKRVEEYIRNALPLFEPMEDEVNAAVCDEVFDILYWSGSFGPHDSVPRPLQGSNVEFRFKSPFKEAEGRERATKFIESAELLAQAANIDPTVAHSLDVHKAFRDALTGANVPDSWVREEEDALERAEQDKTEAAAQRLAEGALTGASAVKEAAAADQELQRAAATR